MYKINFHIFNTLPTNQKSSIKSFFKTVIKKKFLSCKKIVNQDILDELYYELQLPYSRYSWLKEYINNRLFQKDLQNIIKIFIQQQEYKENNKLYIEKQKEVNKKIRKEILKYKQSKEKPTKKQISYYNSLCKKYSLEIEDIRNKSKLDLINMISENVNKEKNDIK